MDKDGKFVVFDSSASRPSINFAQCFAVASNKNIENDMLSIFD